MQYLKNHSLAIVIICFIIGVAGFFTWSVVNQRIIEGKKLNSATLVLETGVDNAPYTDLQGNELNLTKHVGEVLVVNSWASWSPASAQELVLWSDLVDEYADQGLKVLAINRAEQAYTAERFLAQVGATNKVELVLDADDRYYQSIGGYAMPETVFYDRAGDIVHHHHGVLSEAEMREYIELALFEADKE